MSIVGVTAHGSLGGPLQFDRLEAAFCRQVPLNRHAKTRRAAAFIWSEAVRRRKEISMSLILLIIVLVLLFGGGGGYYGYRRWGTGGGVGIVGLVVIILLVLYLFGGMRM
jgi:hypothetical protein